MGRREHVGHGSLPWQGSPFGPGGGEGVRAQFVLKRGQEWFVVGAVGVRLGEAGLVTQRGRRPEQFRCLSRLPGAGANSRQTFQSGADVPEVAAGVTELETLAEQGSRAGQNRPASAVARP